MTATGSSKKIAKNIAAKLMLDKLDEKEADQADEEEEEEKEKEEKEEEKGQVRVIGTFNIKNFLICLLSSLIRPRELNQC